MMFYLLDLERTITTGKAFYWKQNKHGYTQDLNEAGLFSGSEANRIKINDCDKFTIAIHRSIVDKLLKEV